MNSIASVKTSGLSSLIQISRLLFLSLLAISLSACSANEEPHFAEAQPSAPKAPVIEQKETEQTDPSPNKLVLAGLEARATFSPKHKTENVGATQGAAQEQLETFAEEHDTTQDNRVPKKEPLKTKKDRLADKSNKASTHKNIHKKPQIALIVDDLGYNVAKVENLLQLKQPITLALIPNTPHAKKIAKTIEKEGYELMLHIPMETVGSHSWEHGLTDAMERNQFDKALTSMIHSFPTAKGINNHGGSLLTQKREKMDWVMEALVNEELYFVDSRTIASSVAAEAADEAGLGLLSRDVFLDNERSYASIEREMQKLQRIALKRGSAIGIAHPYHETLAVLEDMMPKMVSEGFEFVFISEIASIHTDTLKKNLH